MIIAIDFDHTIHDTANPLKGRRMGAPLEGAKDTLDDLEERGYTIVVHTLQGKSGQTKHIEDWLDYYEIPYNEVTNIKPDAEVYIDNKALHFTNWKDTAKELNKRLNHE